MTSDGGALAESVPADSLHRAIRDLGISHVVTVPDTYQRSLLARLYQDPGIQVITASTEDEAVAINAGLHAGGAKPMLVVQHVGVFASLNSIRGVAVDMRVPTFALVGLYGHDVRSAIREDRGSAVRLLEPVLDAMEVPYFELNGPGDIGVLRTAFECAHTSSGPAFVLVVAQTA